MSEHDRTSPEARIARARCPWCHDDVAPGQPVTVCRACHALHHTGCCKESHRCAACGAGLARERRPLAVPTPAKEPWIAVGLTLVVPGLGHAYAAGIETGIAVFVALVFGCLAAVLALPWPLAAIAIPGLELVVLVDAWRAAARAGRSSSRPRRAPLRRRRAK